MMVVGVSMDRHKSVVRKKTLEAERNSIRQIPSNGCSSREEQSEAKNRATAGGYAFGSKTAASQCGGWMIRGRRESYAEGPKQARKGIEGQRGRTRERGGGLGQCPLHELGVGFQLGFQETLKTDTKAAAAAVARSPAAAETLEAARADGGTRKDGWDSKSDARTGTFNARSEDATGQVDDSGAVRWMSLIGRAMVRQSRTAHMLPSQHEGDEAGLKMASQYAQVRKISGLLELLVHAAAAEGDLCQGRHPAADCSGLSYSFLCQQIDAVPQGRRSFILNPRWRVLSSIRRTRPCPRVGEGRWCRPRQPFRDVSFCTCMYHARWAHYGALPAGITKAGLQHVIAFVAVGDGARRRDSFVSRRIIGAGGSDRGEMMTGHR
ncbi:hypothetical protein BKA66DRAFT_577832 [Pyrenochaeta sp. MPI-SDFR-AT-0127]|nr:hypothetical protein BKA66DRAFT_577832 [Pyrenochaeta sp. MPI-SDFR-AT-0127]